MPYEIRVPAFSGPLDLLLRLIEERQLDVTTVALAEVTDQYLAHLRQLATPDPDEWADFLVIAARLLLLKSRLLLPSPVVAATEEDAEDLAEQLRAFQRYKHASEALGARWALGLRAYAREAPPPAFPPPPLPAGAGLPLDLWRAYQRWRALQAPPSQPVAGPRFRLADKLRHLRDGLLRWGRLRFRALARSTSCAAEVIVLFLAVLELQRRGFALAHQAEPFGEIVLTLREGHPGAGPWPELVAGRAADDGMGDPAEAGPLATPPAAPTAPAR